MFRAGFNPKISLALDNLKKNRGGLPVENPGIVLLSNRLTNKHGDGGHCLTIWGVQEGHPIPPKFEGEICRLLIGPKLLIEGTQANL
jgi:hypothetical protein